MTMRAVSGDAVTALMESEGLTFPEAVERLAEGAKTMDKKAEAARPHSAAEAYRMMEASELEELALSIKANGLRDPITVGVIGRERWIVDGRNREKACQIAGVPPEYEEIEFDREDAIRAFVADRNERRNISAGQKAMAYALLFPTAPTPAERGAKGGKGNKAVQPPNSFSKALLSQARIVLEYSRPLALEVRDGPRTLNDAYEMVKAEKQRGQSDETKRAELEADAPDFYQLVKDEQMKLNEAYAAMLERKRQRQTAIEQAKFAADNGLAQFARTVLTISLGASVTDERIVSESRFAEITEAYETLKKLMTDTGGEQ